MACGNRARSSMLSVNTGVDILNGIRTCAEKVDGSSFYINEPVTG